jgi:membrane-bound metal-dependent hydrolase YbcI (DUF457 family)
MPSTPFHLGPALFLGLLLFGFLDFPTFLIASVVVDVEPFTVVFMRLDYPLHGFFHSCVGGTIPAVVLASAMFRLRSIAGRVMRVFRLEQRSSRKRILATSLLGVYLHILLDTPLYTDIRPFYPLDLNPLLSNNMSTSIVVYMLCVFSFFGAVVLCLVRLAVQIRKKPRPSGSPSSSNGPAGMPSISRSLDRQGSNPTTNTFCLTGRCV